MKHQNGDEEPEKKLNGIKTRAEESEALTYIWNSSLASSIETGPLQHGTVLIHGDRYIRKTSKNFWTFSLVQVEKL